jgi:YbgC/YbaW family acyl-CoA thioester hydrolase
MRLETKTEIIVRSTDIDVNRHVNNAKYVEYLEWGREEFYERSGADYQSLLAIGVITVTVNLNLSYRRECRQGETLIVQSRPARLGRTSFVVRQEIWTQAGALAADAEVTIVTIDSVTRRPRPVPEVLARHFAEAGREESTG